MSTRTQIGFYDEEGKTLPEWDALIYKHHDGYPEGMVPLLKRTLKRFAANRGLCDTEYASAYFVAAGKHAEMMEDNATEIRDSGWGICKDLHGDIEYFYAVSPAGVKVYAVHGYSDDPAEMFAAMQELTEWSFKF